MSLIQTLITAHCFKEKKVKFTAVPISPAPDPVGKTSVSQTETETKGSANTGYNVTVLQ